MSNAFRRENQIFQLNATRWRNIDLLGNNINVVWLSRNKLLETSE